MKVQYRVFLVVILIIISTLVGCSSRNIEPGDLKEIKDYLKATPYTEFLYSELLKIANTKAKNMAIEDLNMSISKDGYINSIVFDYNMNRSESSFTFMYKRDSDYIKILEHPGEGAFKGILSADTHVLELMDKNPKNPWDWHAGEEAYVIDLEAPSAIITPTLEGNVYVDGIRAGQFPKEVEGITFFVYGLPMGEESNFRICVFTP